MRQRVGHLKNGADSSPGGAVQTVIEIGLVRAAAEITVDAQIDDVLLQGDGFDCFWAVGFGADHHN